MKSRTLYLIGILVAQLLILTQTQFTVWPETILYPWLLTHNYHLYTDIINPYFPLLPLKLQGLFVVFGAGVVQLKIFAYILILTSSWLIFLIVRKMSSEKKALIACLLYVLLQFSFGGNQLWFEHALVPAVLGYCYFLYFAFKRKDFILAGICLAVAVMIKQNALLFLLPGLILIYQRKQIKMLINLIIPTIIATLLLGFYLVANNNLTEFIQWAVKLPLSFSSQPGFKLLPNKREVLETLFLLSSAVATRWIKNKFFWISLLIVSVSFSFPRFENFHLQILVALSTLLFIQLPKKYIMVVAITALLLFGKTLKTTWHSPDRFLDQGMFQLTEKIKPMKSVYLLNSPELAYFFADKLPPKPWAINFPWYFESDFEQTFINGLAKNQPEFVVIGDPIGGGKYDIGNYLPEKLLGYIQNNYLYQEKFNNYQIWRLKE